MTEYFDREVEPARYFQAGTRQMAILLSEEGCVYHVCAAVEVGPYRELEEWKELEAHDAEEAWSENALDRVMAEAKLDYATWKRHESPDDDDYDDPYAYEHARSERAQNFWREGI